MLKTNIILKVTFKSNSFFFLSFFLTIEKVRRECKTQDFISEENLGIAELASLKVTKFCIKSAI